MTEITTGSGAESSPGEGSPWAEQELLAVRPQGERKGSGDRQKFLRAEAVT